MTSASDGSGLRTRSFGWSVVLIRKEGRAKIGLAPTGAGRTGILVGIAVRRSSSPHRD